MGRVLVTGGAGYIGSHTVKELRRAGFDPIVVDNLSEGHRAAVTDGDLRVGDCCSREVLDGILGTEEVDAVVHFAARCYVGESVTDPRQYYDANLTGSLNLLGALKDHGVGRFLFSSSCAVYGDPGDEALSEDRPHAPVNPYGRTKAAFEGALRDFDRAYAMRHVSLRYFNAAGADPDGELGEDHDPETHLVPLVLRTALGGGEGLRVFGDDYPTPDGTCIRDYVHVRDLAEAHVASVRHLMDGGESLALNLGTGEGSSVLDVIRAVERRSGRGVEYEVGPRRAGDPTRLVAVPGRAEQVLGWRPRYSNLDTIVDTAYRWHEAHPEGYP